MEPHGTVPENVIEGPLALQPKIVLLDEPTSALDPELVTEVLQVIRTLADEGQTMIIVTHEMGFAHQICDRIFFLEAGSIYDSGTPDYIFGPEARERTRAFAGRYRQQQEHTDRTFTRQI
ncbi:hypothetical protein ACL2XP_15555 [Sodalis sp. RH21]|uniref:hypothetical protein n=1 Tax=unclassified Sodalis (in: enterobacteria) TaxID=2636512 RepID=UPI0039B618F8